MTISWYISWFKIGNPEVIRLEGMNFQFSKICVKVSDFCL